MRRKSTIVGVEVSPVRFTTVKRQRYAEVTTPRLADRWGVYYRRRDGTAEWIRDFKTKAAATKYAKSMAKR